MAVDSAGYSTSALFQAKDYNSNALATGLQSAANYDPTQQSTAQPTSAARFLRQTNSPNTLYQDAAPAAQNTASAPQTAATQGLTAASNNAVFPSYQSRLVTKPSTLPAQTNVSGTGGAGLSASNANSGVVSTGATTATLGQAGLTYGGPTMVNVGGNYYQFNPTTGAYQYAGYYPPGTRVNGILATDLSGLDPKNQMNQAQQLATLSNSSAVAGNLAAYHKDVAAAQAQNQANQATAAGTAQRQSTLDYLTTHGGQLSAQDAALLNRSQTGNADVSTAQRAAIAQAQADYAAQQQHAAVLAGLQMGAIDTSASDEADAAAQRSLASQMASRNYGADAGIASRFGNFDAGALAGQHQLNHEKAAATSYNNNLSNFANALSTQYGYDKEATGNQLYSDIQGVQQIAQQLQQELGQLSTSAGQKAQGQINSLNNMIQQYQQAVNAYGQGSQQAMDLAKGILNAAGTVAAGV